MGWSILARGGCCSTVGIIDGVTESLSSLGRALEVLLGPNQRLASQGELMRDHEAEFPSATPCEGG
jgi:hypothetical protein